MAGPEHTLIKPGEVRNPGGRPKGISTEKIARGFHATKSRAELEAIIADPASIARDVTAARWVLDALDGKEKARDTLVARESGAVQQSTKIELSALPADKVLDAINEEKMRLASGYYDD